MRRKFKLPSILRVVLPLYNYLHLRLINCIRTLGGYPRVYNFTSGTLFFFLVAKIRKPVLRKTHNSSKSSFLIPLPLQPDGVNLRYFKLSLVDLKRIHGGKYERSGLQIFGKYFL